MVNTVTGNTVLEEHQKILEMAYNFYRPEIVSVDDTIIQEIKPTESSCYDFDLGPERNHVFSLLNASQQFCFFLGTSDYRPDGINGEVVVDFLLESFQLDSWEDIREDYLRKIKKTNITLLQERIKLFNEVFEHIDLDYYAKYYDNDDKSLEMILELPGFRVDPFRKKAFYALQTTAILNHRETNVPLPCDYQIPKVMKQLGILKYNSEIIKKIENDHIFIENSKEELAIRSATYIAAHKITQNGINPAMLDQWLFLQKQNIESKHHLCYTTNY